MRKQRGRKEISMHEFPRALSRRTTGEGEERRESSTYAQKCRLIGLITKILNDHFDLVSRASIDNETGQLRSKTCQLTNNGDLTYIVFGQFTFPQTKLAERERKRKRKDEQKREESGDLRDMLVGKEGRQWSGEGE